MDFLGKALKEARESKSLSIEEAATITKIHIKFIRALEEENFAILPAQIYTVGFIKNLCKLYDIDYLPLVEEYKKAIGVSMGEEAETFEAKKTEEAISPGSAKMARREKKYFKSKRRLSPLIPIVAVIVLAIIYLVFVSLGNKEGQPVKDTQDKKPAVEQPAEKPVSEEPQTNEQPAEEINPADYVYISEKRPEDAIDVMVKLSDVEGSECWTRVVADGVKVYEGTLKESEKIRIFAENEINLTVGNLKSVEIYKDGVLQDYDYSKSVVLKETFRK